jgi:hypothetical protein
MYLSVKGILQGYLLGCKGRMCICDCIASSTIEGPKIKTLSVQHSFVWVDRGPRCLLDSIWCPPAGSGTKKKRIVPSVGDMSVGLLMSIKYH